MSSTINLKEHLLKINTEKIRDKILSLNETVDSVYLHPHIKNPVQLAFFGVFQKYDFIPKDSGEKVYYLELYNTLRFSSVKAYGGKIWLPEFLEDKEVDEIITVGESQILNGNLELFINEEIEEAMEDKANPNYHMTLIAEAGEIQRYIRRNDIEFDY